MLIIFPHLANDKEWVGFENKNMEIVIDLGSVKEVGLLAARFLQYTPASIQLPSSVAYLLSKDGVNYQLAASVPMEISLNDQHDCWIDMAQAKVNGKARYIKVIALTRGGWLFCDEVFVNPQ